MVDTKPDANNIGDVMIYFAVQEKCSESMNIDMKWRGLRKRIRTVEVDTQNDRTEKVKKCEMVKITGCKQAMIDSD